MNKLDGNIIEIKNLRNRLKGKWVHDGLSVSIKQNEIVAIIGASGCGKTTLFRSILMLLQPTDGEIRVFGTDVVHCGEREANEVRRRWGVMFQSGALFSSLSVLENIKFPMEDVIDLPVKELDRLARLKVALVGLEADAGTQFPSELSGGMRKRASMARAMALDPELLFLDEPTAGLDPKSAGELDELVLHLRDSLGLTFLIVTHDLDTLWRVPDRVMFMGEGTVLACEPMKELVRNDHPLIRAYFSGARSTQRMALQGSEEWNQE